MSTPYYVIVDDRDDNVTTTGNVDLTENLYQEYQNTDTRISATGPKVSLEFWGTSIAAYITLPTTNDPPNVLNFTLDGTTYVNTTISPSASEGELEHYQIFNSSAIDYAAHTLVTEIQEFESTLLVDYWIITAPLEADVSGLTLLYDDAHPDFVWSEGWEELSGVGYHENMGWTLHEALDVGSTVSLNFTGSTIQIRTSIPEDATVNQSIAALSVDSQFVSNLTVSSDLPGILTGASANRAMYGGNFTPGEHTMVITALVPAAFFLDYILVTGVSPQDITSNASPSSSTTGTSTGSASNSNSTEGSSSHNTHTSSHHSSTGAIAGGVVGAVIGLLLIVATAFYLWRRWQSSGPTSMRPRLVEGTSGSPPPSFVSNRRTLSSPSAAGYIEPYNIPGSSRALPLAMPNPNEKSPLSTPPIARPSVDESGQGDVSPLSATSHPLASSATRVGGTTARNLMRGSLPHSSMHLAETLPGHDALSEGPPEYSARDGDPED